MSLLNPGAFGHVVPLVSVNFPVPGAVWLTERPFCWAGLCLAGIMVGAGHSTPRAPLLEAFSASPEIPLTPSHILSCTSQHQSHPEVVDLSIARPCCDLLEGGASLFCIVPSADMMHLDNMNQNEAVEVGEAMVWEGGRAHPRGMSGEQIP